MHQSTDLHIHGDEAPRFTVERSGVGNGTIVIGIGDAMEPHVVTLYLHNDQGKAMLTLATLVDAIDKFVKSTK